MNEYQLLVWLATVPFFEGGLSLSKLPFLEKAGSLDFWNYSFALLSLHCLILLASFSISVSSNTLNISFALGLYFQEISPEMLHCMYNY